MLRINSVEVSVLRISVAENVSPNGRLAKWIPAKKPRPDASRGFHVGKVKREELSRSTEDRFFWLSQGVRRKKMIETGCCLECQLTSVSYSIRVDEFHSGIH